MVSGYRRHLHIPTEWQGKRILLTFEGAFRTKDDCLMAYPPAATATSYTVPDGCKELYYAAFGKCNNLEEITLPDSLLYRMTS